MDRRGAHRGPPDRAEGAHRLATRASRGRRASRTSRSRAASTRCRGGKAGGAVGPQPADQGRDRRPLRRPVPRPGEGRQPARAPGHISWNVWIDGAWRQMAIIQGEGLELSEVPLKEWSGGTHPGRIRFQTFRPRHGEPLTDALIGQGMMSLGGGGYGGGGLPYPGEVLQLWGGETAQGGVGAPEPADGGERRRLGRAHVRARSPSARRAAARAASGAVEGGRAGDAPLGQRDRRRRLRRRPRRQGGHGPAADRGLAEGVDGRREVTRASPAPGYNPALPM